MMIIIYTLSELMGIAVIGIMLRKIVEAGREERKPKTQPWQPPAEIRHLYENLPPEGAKHWKCLQCGYEEYTPGFTGTDEGFSADVMDQVHVRLRCKTGALQRLPR